MQEDKISEAISRLESHTQYYIPVEDLPAFELALEALRKISEFVNQI